MEIRIIKKRIGLFRKVTMIQLTNRQNFSISLVDLGASIYDISYYDQEFQNQSVTLSFRRMKDFCQTPVGKIYQLKEQENIYKKKIDFDNIAFRKWSYKIIEEVSQIRVIFRIQNKNPFGSSIIIAEYTIKEDTTGYDLQLKAMCDKEIPIHITSRLFLNLSSKKEDILHHILTMKSSRIAKLNSELFFEKYIPVSELFDFQKGKRIGEQIDSPILQDSLKGYNHTFLFDDLDELSILKTELYCPSTRRYCHIFTNYPCVSIYTSNDSIDTYNGVYSGILIEPKLQAYSNMLSPERTYSQRIYYRFGSK